MSNKPNDNKEEQKGPSSISHSLDKFSFQELKNYLESENISKMNIEKEIKKKPPKEKKGKKEVEEEKRPKLKIQPNLNIAREQKQDEFMYIEKEEDIKKEEEKIKELKKEKKEEKKIQQANNNEQKKPVDKRIIKLNLEKNKKEEKQNYKLEMPKRKKGEHGYYIEEIIKNAKEKAPDAYTPIVLPFESDEPEEKCLKDEFNEDDEDQKKLFIFQFPRQIPIKGLKKQIEIKEEENVNEQPNYDDQNEYLKIPEFTNTFKEIKDNTIIGKLVIMKSGKIKIKMGETYFDINQGSLSKFAQYSTLIAGDEENQAFILGQPLNKKLIATPEFQ